MSNINVNSLDNAYPVAGYNNSTQGFRDNFTNIKNNLQTAKEEITDLQNKVVVKATLTGGVLDNDMAGTLISNALTKGFRKSMWPISAGYIPSDIKIDVSKGDVQYGVVAENTTISFSNWSPAGTKSELELNLYFANTSAFIQLPNSVYDSTANVVSGMTNSVRILENYASNANPIADAVAINQLTVPAGVTELKYIVSSTDCGVTMDIQQVNRNQTASYIQLRIPGAYGNPGDTAGCIATYNGILYACTDTYNATATLATTSASGNGSSCTLFFATQNIAPYAVGGTIVVSGVTPTGYNGTHTVSACTTGSVSFSGTATGSQTIAGSITGRKVIWAKVAMSAVT